MTNSSQKGSEYERTIAKKLSYWASNNTDRSLFWRTGMSGGRHTIGVIQGVGYGDLQVLKPTPEAIRFMNLFCVELKHYKEFELYRECDNSGSNLRKWWAKLITESELNQVQPMLIVKPNRYPDLIMFDINQFSKITPPRPNIWNIILNFAGFNIICFKLEDFLSDYSFKEIKKLVRSPK